MIAMEGEDLTIDVIEKEINALVNRLVIDILIEHDRELQKLKGEVNDIDESVDIDTTQGMASFGASGTSVGAIGIGANGQPIQQQQQYHYLGAPDTLTATDTNMDTQPPLGNSNEDDEGNEHRQQHGHHHHHHHYRQQQQPLLLQQQQQQQHRLSALSTPVLFQQLQEMHHRQVLNNKLKRNSNAAVAKHDEDNKARGKEGGETKGIEINGSQDMQDVEPFHKQSSFSPEHDAHRVNSHGQKQQTSTKYLASGMEKLSDTHLDQKRLEAQNQQYPAMFPPGAHEKQPTVTATTINTDSAPVMVPDSRERSIEVSPALEYQEQAEKPIMPETKQAIDFAVLSTGDVMPTKMPIDTECLQHERYLDDKDGTEELYRRDSRKNSSNSRSGVNMGATLKDHGIELEINFEKVHFPNEREARLKANPHLSSKRNVLADQLGKSAARGPSEDTNEGSVEKVESSTRGSQEDLEQAEPEEEEDKYEADDENNEMNSQELSRLNMTDDQYKVKTKLLQTWRFGCHSFMLLCCNPSVAKQDEKMLEAALALIPESLEQMRYILNKGEIEKATLVAARAIAGTTGTAGTEGPGNAGGPDDNIPVHTADGLMVSYGAWMFEIFEISSKELGILKRKHVETLLDKFFSRSYDRVSAEVSLITFSSIAETCSKTMAKYELISREILSSERLKQVFVLLLALARYAENNTSIDSFRLDVLPRLKTTPHPNNAHPTLLHALVHALLKKCPQVFPLQDEMNVLVTDLPDLKSFAVIEELLAELRSTSSLVYDIIQGEEDGEHTKDHSYVLYLEQQALSKPRATDSSSSSEAIPTYYDYLGRYLETFNLATSVSDLSNQHGLLRAELSDMLTQIGEPNTLSRQRQYEVMSFIRTLVVDVDNLWRTVFYPQAVRETLVDTVLKRR